MPGPEILIPATLALFLAATVKGFVGMGLPTVALALMTLSLDPRTAISLILVPMLATNLWQAVRGGPLSGIVVKYWRFAVALALFVVLSVWLTRGASDRVLLFVLGAIIVVFTALSWRNLIPEVPERFGRAFEIVCGAVGGIIGGMTAAWAAPIAIFLSARRAPRDEFVQATGFLISAGSLPLMLSYLALGHVERGNFGASFLLLIPVLFGFSIGEALRKRTDPEVFRKVFLLVFFGLGLNLIYRTTVGA